MLIHNKLIYSMDQGKSVVNDEKKHLQDAYGVADAELNVGLTII